MQNIGQSKSLSSRVAEQIENLIREGKFTSGQQIPNETQLQQQMNVGRGAVREAIKILVAKNMLEVRRGQGTFVVENPGVVEDPLGLSLEKDQDKVVRDLHQVRCELEPLAAKLAAKNITEEEQTFSILLCDFYIDGVKTPQTLYGVSVDNSLQLASLPLKEGRKANGYMLFQAPTDWKELEIIYNESLIHTDDEKIIKFKLTKQI